MENFNFFVYVRIDENNRIVEVNSSAFLTDTVGWIQIDEGTGDKYFHAQGNYFDESLTDFNGCHLYHYENGQVRKATDEELAAELAEIEAAKPPVLPTPVEELQAENKLLRAQIQAQTERNDFMEDCIAEMAIQVYNV